MSLSRRAFFGAARAEPAFRPPWALAEAAFQEACTRCGECLAVCPTGLLVKGGGGYPEAAFGSSQAPEGCTFCGECCRACQPQALREVAGQAPWVLQAVFSAACLAERGVVCRTCGESCETRAIHFPPALGGVSRPRLDAAACTGCGACLADCPTQAIRIAAPNSPSLALRGAA